MPPWLWPRLSDHRPDEEGIKTVRMLCFPSRVCFQTTDLMKKGLRRSNSPPAMVVFLSDHRPDEEGIKT